MDMGIETRPLAMVNQSWSPRNEKDQAVPKISPSYDHN